MGWSSYQTTARFGSASGSAEIEADRGGSDAASARMRRTEPAASRKATSGGRGSGAEKHPAPKEVAAIAAQSRTVRGRSVAISAAAMRGDRGG